MTPVLTTTKNDNDKNNRLLSFIYILNYIPKDFESPATRTTQTKNSHNIIDISRHAVYRYRTHKFHKTRATCQNTIFQIVYLHLLFVHVLHEPLLLLCILLLLLLFLLLLLCRLIFQTIL